MSTNRSTTSKPSQGRIVPLTGFPGSGKSAAALKLSEYLRPHGISTGIVLHDYGSALSDAAICRQRGLPVEVVTASRTLNAEVLEAAIARLHDKGAAVVMVEFCGNAVDISRTVLDSVRAQGRFSIAPLTAFIENARAAEVISLNATRKLPEELKFLYTTQLEEADFVVVNHRNAPLPKNVPSELTSEVTARFPQANIFATSERDQSGWTEWCDCVMREQWTGRLGPATDPDRYTAALGQLAWFNCTVSISSVRYFDGGKVLLDLGSCIQQLLQQEGASVSHLKMVLTPDHNPGEIAFVSISNNDSSPTILHQISEPIQRGELTVNLRAQSDPEILHSVVNRALLAVMERSTELFARMQHSEHFRPGLAGMPQRNRTAARVAT